MVALVVRRRRTFGKRQALQQLNNLSVIIQSLPMLFGMNTAIIVGDY